MSLFPSTFVPMTVFSLYGWRVRRTFFLPDGVLPPRDHGLFFLHQLMC